MTGNGDEQSDSTTYLKGCYAKDQVVTQVNAMVVPQGGMDESIFEGRSQHHRAEHQSVVQRGLKGGDTSGV